MGHAWGMGPPSSPKAAPRTAHIFPLPLLIFLNGFIPIASVLLHNPFRILLNLEYLQTELAFKGR